MAEFEDDAEIMAEIAERNEAENAAIAAAVAARRQAATPDAAFSFYAAECLSRARAWAYVHAERAAARDLPEGDYAWVCAAEIFSRLQDAAEARGLSPSLTWAARKAYDAAFAVTEWEKGGGRYTNANLHQRIECEESPIRTICGTLICLADRRWQASEGFLTPAQAHLAAAADIIAAPPAPPVFEDCTP